MFRKKSPVPAVVVTYSEWNPQLAVSRLSELVHYHLNRFEHSPIFSFVKKLSKQCGKQDRALSDEELYQLAILVASEEASSIVRDHSYNAFSFGSRCHSLFFAFSKQPDMQTTIRFCILGMLKHMKLLDKEFFNLLMSTPHSYEIDVKIHRALTAILPFHKDDVVNIFNSHLPVTANTKLPCPL